MTDRQTNESDAGKNRYPPHLEELFLIAQFYARDTDEAARLVDRVYRAAYADDGTEPPSLSHLVEALVEQSRQMHPEVFAAPETRSDARTVRAREADRLLDRTCRLAFLEMEPDARLALWHAVETGSEPGMLLTSDALGSFSQRIEALLTREESQVYGQCVNRSSVAGALRRFWETGFVPVPPTLRSVVESSSAQFHSGEHIVQTKAEREAKPRGGLLRRITVYAWVIVAATAIGYFLTRAGEPAPPSNDILELSLSASDDVDLTFRTDNAEQAEIWIEERFGWRLSVPEITDASLEGVSVVRIVDSVELPVVVFTDHVDEATIPVFTFTYAFLETNSERFRLSRSTLRQIQEASHFDVHQYRKRMAVVWRDRDDIFAAFVSGENPEFQSRIVVRS